MISFKNNLSLTKWVVAFQWVKKPTQSPHMGV